MNTLRGLRGLRNLSQEKLAEKAGMSQAEISRIERGLQPSKNQLEKLQHALGLQKDNSYETKS